MDMDLHHAPSNLCFRRMAPGEVKRCLPRGPVLVGYWICCPRCGKTFQYLHDQVEFVEVGWTRHTEVRPACDLGGADDDEAPREVFVEHPVVLGAARPITCYGCAREIHLRDNRLEAAP